MLYPLAALVALLLYQGTNAGLYYLIGTGVWFWAFGEGEVCAVPISFWLSSAVDDDDDDGRLICGGVLGCL